MSAALVAVQPRLAPVNPEKPLEAVRFVRRMRGGSGASLIHCSDGQLYVVKFSSNPQGPHLLANEVLGAELLRLVGLPSPGWKPVLLSQSYLLQTGDPYFELFSSRRPIPAGVHFGSKFLGEEQDRCIYEILPSVFNNRIVNVDDLLGVYILDVLANHCDVRQPIFVTEPDGRSLKAVFIDNGHIFGGPRHDQIARPGEALCLDVRHYSVAWSRTMVKIWIDRFQSLLDHRVYELIDLVPDDWNNGDLERVLTVFRFRLHYLAGIFSRELRLLTRADMQCVTEGLRLRRRGEGRISGNSVVPDSTGCALPSQTTAIKNVLDASEWIENSVRQPSHPPVSLPDGVREAV